MPIARPATRRVSSVNRVRAVAAAAALVCVLAACSSPSPPVTTGAPTSPATSAAPTAATPAPTAPPQITLAFAGDVHFTERTLTLLSAPTTAFGPVSEVFSAADVAMVNLESAVTTRGTPEPKTFHFRAPSSAFQAIAAAGIDVVTNANNHALDYGRVGLSDTIAAASAANMPLIGVGPDAARAYAPWVTTVKGVRIAFLGFSQILELAPSWVATDARSGVALAYDNASTARAVAAVTAARAMADVVVVYMHWGQEYNECPTGAQKSLAAKLVAAGATLVVGTHAHVLQGAGWLGKTYVSYGLSNFLWWYNDAGSNDTGVLRVTLTGTVITKTDFVPAYISRSTGQPIPSSGAEADRISTKFAGLHSCTGLAAAPS
jgi:poly-gamma-glutamate capsule biosynthesis protein CapA/YwtB (metallophosphatase superfamily)